MRAYRVRTGRTIAPFGDEVRDLFVGTETIAAWQEAGARACGLELTDIAELSEAIERPCLVFFDDLYFTEMALRQFVAEVIASNEDLALAMPDSAAMRAHRVLDDEPAPKDGAFPYDIFALKAPAPAGSREALRSRCRPVVQTARELTMRMHLPIHEDGQEVNAPLSARIVAEVRHWVHLLRLSQLSIGVTLMDRLRRSPRLLFRLRLMRKKDPWEIARKVNFVDPTARVHPTADLEGAVIGPNAIVRAHAHVHRSIVGAGVEVGDHAVVMGSTLAERVHVLRASYFAGIAAMPGATLSSYKAQISLFGRDVFLTASAVLLDAKLRGDVSVEHDGRKVSTGFPFLGACLGHRVRLGAEVTIQPGRAVPNGVTIVAPPGGFAGELPFYEEGTILIVRDGRAVPLGSDDPEHR